MNNNSPPSGSSEMLAPTSLANKRRSLRLSMLRRNSQKNINLASYSTITSTVGSSSRRSSNYLRMHESIQSAVASEWEDWQENEGSSSEDDSSIDSAEVVQQPLNPPVSDRDGDTSTRDASFPLLAASTYSEEMRDVLPEEDDPLALAPNQGSSRVSLNPMKDLSATEVESSRQLESLLSRKSSGFQSLGALPGPAAGSEATLKSSREIDNESYYSRDSASARRARFAIRRDTTSSRATIASNRGLKAKMAGSSQDSIVSHSIAPESSKLRGDNDASKLITPLPVQLSRLGLFGREEQVKTLQECLHKYPWTDKSGPPPRPTKKETQTAGSGSEDPAAASPDAPAGNKTEFRRSKRRSTTPKATASHNRQLVWIRGGSGCGKTALAVHALREEVSAHGGLYVTGKFENKFKANNDHPFVGLADACDSLCVQLLASHFERQQDYNNLLECLQKQMTKKEATVILRLIPGLGPILESVVTNGDCMDDTNNTNNTNSSTIAEKRDSAKERIQELLSRELDLSRKSGNKGTPSEGENMQQHFHFVFHKFLHIVAAIFPLVLVFDDLQWADMGSLELLEILLYDRLKFSSNIMIIGCYRDDEVNPEHPLNFLQKEIASKVAAKACSLDIIDMNITNLTPTDLNLLLSELLKEEPSKTESLAQICHRKVGGNAFFFVRFMTVLSQDNLIQYNLASSKWEWDEQLIDESSATTENVINFLQSRLSSLPENTKQLLLFASCLGTEFDLPSMTLVMEDFFHPGVPFQEDLELCLKEGVLEKCNTSTVGKHYRWVHDKLMEASQTLLPSEELPKLKFCVGAALLKHLERQALEDELFVIANLINEAPDLSDTPISIAELNLRAAKKAASLSSFHAAAIYCAQGIALLPVANKWETYFDLTLQLHSTAAHMYSTLGDYEALETECNEVLGRSEVSIEDKIRPYDFLMDSICYRGRLPEAIAMCLGVLRQLGVSFPQNKLIIGFKIGKGLKEAKKTVDSRCQMLRTAPLLEDPVQEGAMRFMGKLCKFGYLAKSPLLPLSAIKMGKYSLKHGVGNDSPKNCAIIGMIIAAFGGDIQTGSKYGHLALELIDHLPEGERMLPEAHFIAYAHVLHNTEPVHTMMKPLLHAYNVSLEWGITEYACFSIYHYLVLAFRSGKALAAIEIDLRAYTKQMNEMQIDKMNVVSRMLWQLLMNLMDFPDTSPLVLTGDAMDEMQFLAAESTNAYYFTMFQSYQSCLYAILGKHELGANLALSKADMLSAHPGSPSVVMDAFYQGVSLFAAARATKTKKYLVGAKKLQAKIDGWARSGNPNVLHFSSFLAAEKAAIKGMKEEAEKHYEIAIVTAAKQGFIQDAALANERLAELYEKEFKDKSSAGFRVQEAVRLYSDWGAHRKVVMLQEAKAELLRWCAMSSHPEEICVEQRHGSGSLGFSSRLSIGSGWGSKRWN